MNLATLLRREWGAVTFIVTVVIGLVIVPLGLYFGNRAPAPVNLTVTSPVATLTPAVTPTPTPPAAPAATPTAKPS